LISPLIFLLKGGEVLRRITITLAIVLGVVFTILCFNPLTAKSVIPKKSPEVKQHTKLDLSYNQIMYKIGIFFQMERGNDIDGLPQYLGMTTKHGTVCIQIVGEKYNVSFVQLVAVLENASDKQIVENDILMQQFLKNISPASVWPEVSQWYINTIHSIHDNPEHIGHIEVDHFEMEMFLNTKLRGLSIMVHKRMP